jgi:glycine/D-amino acid oxidase-like deaminating enzyme/nitrite reductase/ring-hydroxylating ferredoxin subunit
MDTRSFWKKTSDNFKNFPVLSEDIETEIAVIGGGITGLTAALQLIRAGKKVTIVEAQSIAGGTTGYSTGNLYIPVQAYFQTLKNKFDETTVQKVAHSRKAAIDFVEDTIKQLKINCQFQRRPWYLYTNQEINISKIESEAEVLQEAGIAIDVNSDLPLPEPYKKAVKLEDQARFNPYQYVKSLAEKLSEMGCSIYENSKIIETKDGEKCELKTQKGKITAHKVLIATHTPKGVNMVQTIMAPKRSYVVSVTLKSGAYPNGNFWNFDKSPVHAISSHDSGNGILDSLMFAGNHHKTGNGQPSHQKKYEEIENYIHQYYDVAEIKHHWSAQHYDPGDGLPYIGKSSRTSKNFYMATGYAADGLTYGTLAGMIMGDILSGKENKWSKTFDATRFTPLQSAIQFVELNAGVAADFVKDYMSDVKIASFAEIGNGEAKNVTLNGDKLAVYREESGKLHVVSSVCPHLACIVHWNDAEKSWDCPCHGSRFTYEGTVIEGPAIHNLSKRNIS